MNEHSKNTVKEEMPPMLTIKQVMNYLNLSRTTVYEYTQNGTLPGYKIGKNVRYKLSDVQNLLTPIS